MDDTPKTPTPTPAEPTTPSTPPVRQPEAPKKRSLAVVILAIITCSVLSGAAGFFLGKALDDTAPKPTATTQTAIPELTVPVGATQISKCAVGRGAQYAEPKDIPVGPIYNVYKGKVIGLEFMVGKDDLLTANKNFLNLPLFGQKYNHVNIGILSQGHAGFPSPHYHVDIMTAPSSLTDQITCKD